MSAIVFVGPTLSTTEAAAHLDARFLPPVAQGDVYRAACLMPRAIGIIDGYFSRVVSVWHKEILWALSRGIYVFGGASMGALRAVELAPFGMIGVGQIFAAFHRNELEDDDEVAIVHGPPDSNYKSLSEAMVNIRATLTAAVDAGRLSRLEEEALVSIGKALPYAARSYRTLLTAARAQGVKEASLRSLEEWLPSGTVNRKRLDAIGLLRAMRHFLATHPEPYTPDFVFEHTEQWEAARLHALSRTPNGAESTDSELLEEVKVSGQLPSLRRATLARLLARDRPENGGAQSDPVALSREITRLRLEQGLLTEAQFSDWKASQALEDPHELTRVFADQSAVSTAELRCEPEIAASIPDELKLRGEYAAVHARALRKREALARRYLSSAQLSDAGIAEAELWRWYFETVLRKAVPEHMDAHSHQHGFRDVAALRRGVLREYLFRRIDAETVGGPDGTHDAARPTESLSGPRPGASDGW
ncbi:MAG: hypothetical protein RL685_2699 [Pseudomonadota bacterium]|jgi:hypothetical protein